jgi:hypothetical protein
MNLINALVNGANSRKTQCRRAFLALCSTQSVRFWGAGGRVFLIPGLGGFAVLRRRRNGRKYNRK